MLKTAIAGSTEHGAAEAAIGKLARASFATQNRGTVGQGYHKEEKVIRFCSTGDRVRFRGRQGTISGGPGGLFRAGMFRTISVVGRPMASS